MMILSQKKTVFLFCVPPLIVMLFLSVLFGEVFSSELYGGNIDNRGKAGISKNSENKVETDEIDNIIPEKGKSVSLYKVMAVDILVPGGGHFYTDNYYMGITFAALKLVGAYSIYYFYNEWEYRRSLYYASKKANEDIDPDHQLEFRGPDGDYKTVEEYHREYDRAAQNITFAVLANVIIYIASITVLYYNVKEINENSIPTFEFQYSCAKLGSKTEEIASFSCNFRI